MKEKEGYIEYPDQQMILYVEKEDGSYGPMQTGSYLSANYMDDYLLKRRNLEADLRRQLTEGIISPVKYYMVLIDLSVSELSSRVGIRKSRVKKHLEPRHFGEATIEELSRYAAVFNVPLPNLLQVMLVNINGSNESAFILEHETGEITISQSATGNPYVVVTKLEKRP